MARISQKQYTVRKQKGVLMANLLETMIDLQLGLLTTTKDRVGKIVNDLVKEGELDRSKGKKLIDEFISKGEKSKLEIRKKVELMIADYLKKLDIPSRQDIEEIRNEIDLLRRVVTRERMKHGH
jgi:polyhydroxyalkanoate synthesis regulator phasin